jgi:predicted dienelactone hydrolase
MFAGFRQLSIHDATQNAPIPVLVFYPTELPATTATLGPYQFEVSPDAPAAAGAYPMVVISHGSGGTHILYRTIAMHLAKNGYVVAVPEHPGNNRLDNSLYGTVDNLVNRPRHVRLVLDTLAADAALGSVVQADKAAVIGHSMGGYTALAVAGGMPWSKEGKPVAVATDARVRAIVLLAPATAWYQPEDALARVEVPILMITGEHDDITPQWHADLVLDRVPERQRVHFRVVENAGHFSFLSPFPPKLKAGGFAPTQDPEGFDREAFHEQLPEEIRQFLDRHLKSH